MSVTKTTDIALVRPSRGVIHLNRDGGYFSLSRLDAGLTAADRRHLRRLDARAISEQTAKEEANRLLRLRVRHGKKHGLIKTGVQKTNSELCEIPATIPAL